MKKEKDVLGLKPVLDGNGLMPSSDDPVYRNRFVATMDLILGAAKEYQPDYTSEALGKPNPAQQIQELRLRFAAKMNGNVVADDLNAHPKVWESYTLGNDPRHFPFTELRDLKQAYLNVDTLFVRVMKGQEKKMLRVVEEWGADEVGFLPDEESNKLSGGGNEPILRVWWD